MGAVAFVSMNIPLLLVAGICLLTTELGKGSMIKKRQSLYSGFVLLVAGVGVIVFMFLVFDLEAFISYKVFPDGKVWSGTRMAELLKNLDYIYPGGNHYE